MALRQEFVQAVTQQNVLRVKIMLKDSLLIDTSFKQFHEMLAYAESNLKNLWMSNEEDDEVLSSDPKELNIILAGLVNNFSHRRVRHLMGMINKMYPQKTQNSSESRREAAVRIPKTREAMMDYRKICRNSEELNDNLKRIRAKNNQLNTRDIEIIRTIAMRIVDYCDSMKRK